MDDRYHLETGKALMKGGNYLAARRELTQVSVGSTLRSEAEKLSEQAYEQIKPPLSPVSGRITIDSAGVPYVYAVWKNVSRKTIDAYKVRIECFDRYDKTVEHYYYGTNEFRGQAQFRIAPGGKTPSYRHWYMHGFDQLARAEVYIISVHFTDDSEWGPGYSENETPHLTALLRQ